MRIKELFNNLLKFLQIDNDIILKIILYTVLFVVYILPSGLINFSIPIDKLIFVMVLSFFYACNVLYKKKISKSHILFIGAIILFSIIGKTINYFLFIPILFLDKLLDNKERITRILKESPILYICLGFTILYSIINFGDSGRFAYTAIMEKNLSGLAIFCLALLMIKKNKVIGYFVLIFGMLTISRSYYLALILYLLSKLNIIQKLIDKMKKIIKHFNYLNLTILSSIILIAIGYIYIYQFKAGNIFWGDEISNRLINIFDYSNLFRFITNLIVVMILFNSPFKLFSGLSDQEYIELGRNIYESFEIPYKYLEPHNLFFSHLRIYGIFVLIEIIYISNSLKKIINNNNFMIYLAIVAYSVILGAGLYSYWLYLSIFVFLIYEKKEISEIKNNSIS